MEQKMKAHEAKMKSDSNNPDKVKNFLNVCHIEIFRASEEGKYEVSVNLNSLEDPIVEKTEKLLENDGYKVSVFRSQMSNSMLISWKDS
jgi:hypothetical protein